MRKPRDRGAMLFWVYVAHLWTLFGLFLSNLFLAATILTVPWAVRLRRVDWRSLSPVLTPLGLYVLFLVASVGLSHQPAASLPALAEIFSLATLVVGLLVLRDERRLRLAVDGLVGLSAVLSLWGLGQFLFAGAAGLAWRIRGPFSHYMTFAHVLVIADLLLVAQLASHRHGRWGWRWIAVVLINAALVGSLTRSAWVALLVALVVLFWLRAPRFLLVLAPAGALIFFLSPAAVQSRATSIFSLRDVTNYDRVCMLEAGMRMTAERPLFGHGPGMVEVRYPAYRHPTAPLQRQPHLHNSYLQLAAERGIPSLLAYLWLLGGTLWAGYRGVRAERPPDNDRGELWLGAFAALVAFAVGGLFEDSWKDTEVQRVALFVMALPYCLRALASGRSEALPVRE